MRALLPFMQERGSSRDQLVFLFGDVLRTYPDIDVPPVLDRLRLGHGLEDDPLAMPGFRTIGMADPRTVCPDQGTVVGGRLRFGCVALSDHLADEVLVLLLHNPAERLGPPGGEIVRSRAVDRDLKVIRHLCRPSTDTGPGAERSPHRDG